MLATSKAEYSDERVAARNAIAAEIGTAQKIPVNDLNAAVRGHPEYHSDNVHFNNQGNSNPSGASFRRGREVAAAIISKWGSTPVSGVAGRALAASQLRVRLT